MRTPTGSKLPLAMACPASFALPWIEEPVGEPAVRGTVIHAFLEDVQNLGAEVALDRAPTEARPFLQSIDLDRIPLGLMPEAAFALDWKRRTARFLGSGLGRAYPAPASPTEIFLTIDLFGVSPDAVLVDDFKTGVTRYPPPSEFPQTLAAALAGCWTFDRDDAVVGLTYVDKHGEVWPRRERVNGWDLDVFADQLQATMEAIEHAHERVAIGTLPDVRPGDHCRGLYCPAYRTCPATSALVRHMPEHVAEAQRPGYLAPERLARTWKQAREMQAVIEAVIEEIKRLSFREPIDLGDGTELSPREYQVEELDAMIAHDVIDAMIAPGYGAKAIKSTMAKSAIEEVATEWRNNLKGGKDADGRRVVLSSKKGDGLLDRIYAEIRARGGATVKTRTTVGVRKRKELP